MKKIMKKKLNNSFYAGIAQVVEQLNRNQQVGGSSPLSGTIMMETFEIKPLKEYTEWDLDWMDKESCTTLEMGV